LLQSYGHYYTVVNIFSELLKTLDWFELEAGNYFRERFFDYGDNDLEKIVNAILEQADLFKKLGFKFDGKKLRIKLLEEYLKAGGSHE
ncbi:MAG: hypothetical protein IJP68_01760, partial [Selenomonadaceae bacterium]|nr:hypothetical protein [Selenomonadaceae bacterium]